jgi:hypothetical protein
VRRNLLRWLAEAFLLMLALMMLDSGQCAVLFACSVALFEVVLLAKPVKETLIDRSLRACWAPIALFVTCLLADAVLVHIGFHI